jgi:hypothetical protein
MALQREVSPIPPGRYWILVEADNLRDFDDWLRDMHGAAQVEATSTSRASTRLDQMQGVRPSTFVIFRVPQGRMPFLNALQFGFPSFAPPNITSRDDVIQNDQKMDPTDVVVDVVKKVEEGAQKAAEGFGGLLVVALLLLAMGGASALAHR